MRRPDWAILCFLFLIVSKIVIGQGIEFEHLSDEQGLINASVSSVIKDSEGFIWIGTKQGLDRYDGYTLKHFINDPFNSGSLPANAIKCLHNSKNGKLYIGYFGKGFSIYDRITEKFENYSPEDKRLNLTHDTVFAFYTDTAGIVWMGTNAGLDRFDPVQKKLTRFYPFKDFKKQDVTSICPDKDGNLWLYGPDNKPCKFDLKGQKYHYLKHEQLITQSGGGTGGVLMLDSRKNLWFGNVLEGLCKYNLLTHELEKFNLENGFLKSNVINALLEDSEGKIWIGTESAGLFKYNPAGKNFEKHQYIANLINNLTSNNITSILESQPGIIWIGTADNGVNIWKRDKTKFKKIGLKSETDNKLSAPSVLSISPAPDNKLWIGTDGGGLNLFDPESATCSYFNDQNSPVCNNVIKTIITDNEGIVWYGTKDRGLCNIDFANSSASNFQNDLVGTSPKPGFINCAWVLCKSHDNKLWIGLLQGGLKIYDLNRKKFINEFNIPAKFKKYLSGRIQSLLEDTKGQIWIGTEHYGAVCYNPVTKKFTQFTIDEKNEMAIKNSHIKTIFEDRDANIWFGTNKGGLGKLLDFNSKSVQMFYNSEGLSSNHIKNIVEDTKGNLWLGTEKGISSFNPYNGKFRNFDTEDGAQGLKFHSNSSYQTKQGVIYMGGINGFNYFHPDSLHFNTSPPKVVLTEINIFDETIMPGIKANDKIYLEKSIGYIKELNLSYTDNVISFEFAALDFLSPVKNKYAFKLEGFNDNWIYADANHRIASYTNLEPGKYNFRVIASNSDGYWNNEGVSLIINISPPFYRIWWVQVLLGLLVIGGVTLFYFSRTKSIRQRNLQLKEEVENQTQKLRAMNEELTKTSEEVYVQAYELRSMNEELHATADQLAEHNEKSTRLYNELTEGLEAAKLIQNSILPGKELLEKEFGGIDILYRPKNLVSGDFYWYKQMGNTPVIAAVDCTGHGVAGAFMTFIGYEILNQISKNYISADPGSMISMLNREILNSMNYYRSGSVNAGMDVSICILDKDREVLHFAGANHPLYIVRDAEVIIVKGDRQGVGGKQKGEKYQFATNTINLKKGDQIYIFTDGYADQIGGKDHQKFMYSRFRELLVEISSLQVKNRIISLGEAFDKWKGYNEQLDDVLIIGFEYNG